MEDDHIWSLAIACLLAGVAAGGWWVGRQETAAETATLAAETEHKTEAVKQEIRAVSNDLATAALKGGPQKARLWLELIQWNDIQPALGNRKDCSAPNGRQGCYLPFWIEALKASRP